MSPLLMRTSLVLQCFLLIVVVLGRYCFCSRRRWANGHFGYCTAGIFELHHIMLIILQFEGNISMQCISTLPISSCNSLNLADDSPKYTFPFQEDVIAACAEKCQLLSGEHTAHTESALGTIRNWIKAPFTSDKPRGRLLVV